MNALSVFNKIQSASNWAELETLLVDARKNKMLEQFRAKKELLLVTGCAGPRPAGVHFDFERVILAVKVALVAAIKGNQLGMAEATRPFFIRVARSLPLRELAGVPDDSDEGDVGWWVKSQFRSDKASGKLVDDLAEGMPEDMSPIPSDVAEWMQELHEAMKTFAAASSNNDVREMQAIMRLLNPILRDLFIV